MIIVFLFFAGGNLALFQIPSRHELNFLMKMSYLFYECQWKWSRNARDFVKKFHSEGRRQYDLHYQVSAMSLQAAIEEGDSEEEPLKPTSRQAIN